MGCGYTYRDIDQMTLPEMWELLLYLNVNPPAHMLLAARYGYKAPTLQPTETERKFEAQSGPAKPFDCLPLEIQRLILESKHG